MLDWTKFSLGMTKPLPLTGDWSLVCHPYAYRAGRSLILDPAQSEEFLAFLSHCHSQMLLFDVGAHFGFFSLAAARYGGTSIALDPSPMATHMIAIQARLNECLRKIHVLCVAASDKNGIIEMLGAGTFSYGFFRAVKGQTRRDITRVSAITIDEMTRRFGVPTHIKIDVEGHEGEVIRGARTTLNTCSPLVFLELHNDLIRSEGGDPDSVVSELLGAGYEAFDHDGRKARRTSLVAGTVVRALFRRP